MSCFSIAANVRFNAARAVEHCGRGWRGLAVKHCWKHYLYLNSFSMNRSALKIVTDFLIGKNVRFLVEARDIGGHVGISRRYESSRIDSNMVSEWTKEDFPKNREYLYRDEIVIDKIVKVEIKDRRWLYYTLEGYCLERRVEEDIFIVV